MTLAAMLSTAVLAMVLAAQTSLTCTDKVAVPLAGAMSAMPGMEMSTMGAGGAMMICPIVLVLVAASSLLIAAAALIVWGSPHRALLKRSILAALASLPTFETAGAVALAGGGAVSAMLWLERSGPPALPICALLVAILSACALLATVACIAFGRLAIAFGRRLILAIAAAIARSARVCPGQRGYRAGRIVSAYCGCLLAAGRGLRAPPSYVR